MMGYLQPKQYRFVPLWLATINLFLWMNLSVATGADLTWLTDGTTKVQAAAISPDGRLLAYIRETGNKQELLIRFVKDKGNGIAIKGISGRVDGITFRQDSQALAFSMIKDGKSKIFIKNLRDNQDPEQISFGEGSDYHPAFSPDGNQIAFDSDRGGDFEIYVLNLKNRELTQLSHWKQHDFSPTFSPDGKWLAYTSARSNVFQIFLKNLSIPNSLPVQLTQFEAVSSNPSFDASGNGIFFESNLEGKNKIFWFNLKDYQVHRVLEVDGKAQKPQAIVDRLIFASEESGVFGIRSLAISALPGNYPVVGTNPTRLVSISPEKLNEKPDFEQERKKIEEARVSLVKDMPVPKSAFDGYDFDLSFLEEETPLKSQAKEPEVKESEVPELALEPKLNHPVVNPVVEDFIAEQPVVLASTEKNDDVLRAHFAPKRESIVLKTIPERGAKDVELYSPISLILRAVPGPTSMGLMNPRLYANGQEIQVQSQFNEAQKRVDVIPAQSLEPGTQYRLEAGYEVFEFTTAGVATQKTLKQEVALHSKPAIALPLRIARIFPEHRQRNVKVNAPIRVRFNQKLLPESVAADSLQLFANQKLIPGEMIFENGDMELSLKPYQNLLEATIYEIRISEHLKSFDNQPLELETNYQFKTQHFSPFLISQFPEGVLNRPDQRIAIRLNRPADPQSLRPQEFQLKTRTSVIEGKVALEDRGMVLVFSPWQRLQDQQDLMFYLSPNLRDRDGNLLDNARPISLATRFMQEEVLLNEPNQILQAEVDLGPLLKLYSSGVLKSRGAESLIQGREEPSRWRVALVLEEALSSYQMLSPGLKQELMKMALGYETELRNLGIDLGQYQQKQAPARPMLPGVREAQRPMRNPQIPVSEDYRSAKEPVMDDDFVSRARQI